MNTYIVFYNNKEVEVKANTTYEAQKIGAKAFNVKDSQRYRVSVLLAEKGGVQVTHSTASIG